MHWQNTKTEANRRKRARESEDAKWLATCELSGNSRIHWDFVGLAEGLPLSPPAFAPFRIDRPPRGAMAWQAQPPLAPQSVRATAQRRAVAASRRRRAVVAVLPQHFVRNHQDSESLTHPASWWAETLSDSSSCRACLGRVTFPCDILQSPRAGTRPARCRSFGNRPRSCPEHVVAAGERIGA